MNCFLERYNPKTIIDITGNRNDCYFGDYPTLAEINAAYGDTAAAQWLMIQLYAVSEYAGVKDKLTIGQAKTMAQLIAQDFYYLKISELMLFFRYLLNGTYGKFYGMVDAMAIMSDLRHFVVRERNVIQKQHDDEIAREREKESERNAITYEEYLKLKRERENALKGNKE